MEWRRSPKKKRGEKKRRLLRLGAKKNNSHYMVPGKGMQQKKWRKYQISKENPGNGENQGIKDFKKEGSILLNPTTAEKSRLVKANIMGILEGIRKTMDNPVSL